MSYDFWDRPGRPPSRFARRLRLIRSGSGLSQQALAQQAGLDLVRYCALEEGLAKVTVTAVVALARALGVTPDIFFEPD